MLCVSYYFGISLITYSCVSLCVLAFLYHKVSDCCWWFALGQFVCLGFSWQSCGMAFQGAWLETARRQSLHAGTTAKQCILGVCNIISVMAMHTAPLLSRYLDFCRLYFSMVVMFSTHPRALSPSLCNHTPQHTTPTMNKHTHELPAMATAHTKEIQSYTHAKTQKDSSL